MKASLSFAMAAVTRRGLAWLDGFAESPFQGVSFADPDGATPIYAALLAEFEMPL